MKLSQRRLARPSLGGMMATRQGSLALAVVCAACAAGILIFALGRYKSSIRTPVTQATVLVATAEIPKGTSGDIVASEKLYKAMPMATTQVTPGAISDAAELSNETAAVNVLPGQQLTTADFSAVSGVAETLAPSQRAIELPLDETHGANDIVQAGDRVDVYAMFDKTDTLALIDPDALVIKPATPAAVRRDGVPIAGSAMVLQVSADTAARVIYSIDNAGIYLSLRSPNADKTPKPFTNQSTVIHDVAKDTGATSTISPTPPTSTSPANAVTTSDTTTSQNNNS